MSTTILAIDLGKFKSVACAHPREGGVSSFHTIASTRPELTALISRLSPSVVVIEACALAGWVSDLCAELKVACKVANTSSEAWKFKHTKRKTDRDDALRLAQLEALGQLPTVVVPPVATRQKRALIAARQRLVGLRVSAQNRLRALFIVQGLAVPRGAGAWSAAGWPSSRRRRGRWRSAAPTRRGAASSTSAWPSTASS